MVPRILFQDKPLRLTDFSDADQMIIIESCCQSFPEIAEAALEELLKVLYKLDLREVFGFGDDVQDC
jgi:hypothetical protein